MRLNFSIFILIFLLLQALAGYSQMDSSEESDSIQSFFRAKGAENLQYFKTADSSTVVGFEYRLHRNPAVLVRELKNSGLSEQTRLTLFLNGSPWTNVAGDKSSESSTSAWLEAGEKQKITPYKLDLSISPVVYTEFGDARDVVRTQFSLAPKFNWMHRSGISLDFQWIFPIQNDFERRFGYNTRPGEVAVSYTKAVFPNHLLNLTAGTFKNNQYGIGADYFIRKGRNYFGSSANLSGLFLYDQRTLYREPMNTVTGSLFWMHNITKYDLWTRLSFERFLFDDAGGRLDLIRQFGNTDLGFYLIASANGTNGGFSVVVPLYPKAFFKGQFFQIRPANQFIFNYEVIRNSDVGQGIVKYNELERKLRMLHPAFVTKQLSAY